MSSDNSETLQAEYQAGRAAFERGQYRKSVQHLETAKALVEANSQLGGEVQIWLVTAYEAAEQRSQAIDLCRQVSRHPDYTIRKQGQRLLYILEAPKLKTRPEWLTQIPDLTALNESDAQDRKGSSQYAVASSKRAPSKPAVPEPVDLSQVNTKENQFVWLALIAAVATLGGLLWLSQG